MYSILNFALDVLSNHVLKQNFQQVKQKKTSNNTK
jgi:hypothetical protein